MPYAKTDVGFIREHFAAVPEKHRAAAIALYSNLVLISAEMLLDGQLPVTVVLAGAHEIGISRGRYGRSEVSNLGHSLAAAGLVEVSKNDSWTLTHWRDHHASRDYVDSRRKADADRKREAREQLTLPSTPQVVHSGHPTGVRSGQTSDSRAHARTRAASDSKTKDPAAASPLQTSEPDGDPNHAAAALLEKLDQLGLNGTARQLATDDPARAQAWLDVAATEATTNPAGFVLAGLRSGEWPSARVRAQAPPDPVDRRERYVRGDGRLLPADELEFQLKQLGAGDDELVELLDLAADLRRGVQA